MKQRKEKTTIGSKFSIIAARYSRGPTAAMGQLPARTVYFPLQRLEEYPKKTTAYWNIHKGGYFDMQEPPVSG